MTTVADVKAHLQAQGFSQASIEWAGRSIGPNDEVRRYIKQYVGRQLRGWEIIYDAGCRQFLAERQWRASAAENVVQMPPQRRPVQQPPAPPPTNGKDVATTVAVATGTARRVAHCHADGLAAVPPTAFREPTPEEDADLRAYRGQDGAGPHLCKIMIDFMKSVTNEDGWIAHQDDKVAAVIDSAVRQRHGIRFGFGLDDIVVNHFTAASSLDGRLVEDIVGQVKESGTYEPPGQPPPPAHRDYYDDYDEENLPPRPRMARCPAPEIIPSKVVIDMAQALNAIPSKKGWVCLENLELKDIEWLWHNHFVANAINIIAGMGDVGKDVFCCSLAAAASSGAAWPDGAPNGIERRVGYVSPEDNPNDTIGPRLVAAGANKRNVHIWTCAEPPTVAEMRDLDVLFVSPLINLMDGQTDMNREQDARRFLEKWTASGREHLCTVIGTAHLNKNQDLKLQQRIMGASGIVNFTRSNWIIQRDVDKTTRHFSRLKANLSPDSVSGMKFTIEKDGERSQSIRCIWGGPSDEHPDDIQTAVRDDTSERRERQPSAGKWLAQFLTQNGPTAYQDVMEAAKAAGHKEDAIKQARIRSKNPQIISRAPEDYGPTVWYADE